MSCNLFDYYKSKEWKQTELEWVSLNGVYEFRRREQERYESIFGLIENKEKLKPNKLYVKGDEKECRELHLGDGNHRSTTLSERGYSHILAHVARPVTDPPVIKDEQPNKRKISSVREILEFILVSFMYLVFSQL